MPYIAGNFHVRTWFCTFASSNSDPNVVGSTSRPENSDAFGVFRALLTHFLLLCACVLKIPLPFTGACFRANYTV